MSTRAIDQLVEQYQDKIAKLSSKISELKAEMDGLLAALSVASGNSAKAIEVLAGDQSDKILRAEQKLSEIQIELKGVINAKEVSRGAGRFKIDGERSRRISEAWKNILTFILGGGDEGVSLEHIQKFIELNGLNIKDTAVRAQLSIYSSPEKKYLEALGGGRYRITSIGEDLID